MTYSIQPSEDRRFITLKVVGEVTAENMLEHIIRAHKLGKQLAIKRYLVDATEANNVDSPLANYKFAYSDIKRAKGVDRPAVVAAVVSPEDHSHDFIEVALNNAGLPIKLFRELDRAREYLVGES